MALDVYFREDLQQGLVGTATEMLTTAVAHGGTNVEYCRGILDFTRAHAMLYGLSWPAMVRALHDALGECGRQGLLETLGTLPTLEAKR